MIGYPQPVMYRQRPPERTQLTGEHLASLEAYAEFFNHAASLPINQRTTSQRYYIARYFSPSPGDSILDVGAYLGSNLRRYAEEGYDIDGVEVGKAYCDVWDGLKMAVDPQARARTRMFCAMFETWKADVTYDQVLCCEVLEHVIDPQAFVAKIASHMAVGGRAFLATPQEKTRTAARLVRQQDLRAWAEKSGLKVVREIGAIPYKPKEYKGLRGWLQNAWIKTFRKDQTNRPRDWGVAQWICIAQKGVRI